MSISTSVLWTSAGNFVYLLDVERGSYSALSGDQAVLWRERHGSMRSRRNTTSGESRLRHFPLPGVILAARCIWRIRSLLKRGGFHEAYSLAELVAAVSNARRTAPGTPSLDNALARFLFCEALFGCADPARDCLGRSLALFLYLRALGYPVGHYIGIQSLPFAAHAWVLMHGEPLLDTRERLQKFTTISEID